MALNIKEMRTAYSVFASIVSPIFYAEKTHKDLEIGASRLYDVLM